MIHEGGNSGYQAINLAFHTGAKRIVLLGFDMQRTDGKAHWFGNHPGNMQVPSPYADWLHKFEQLAADLKVQGVEVLNCTRETALTCFERVSLDAVC